MSEFKLPTGEDADRFTWRIKELRRGLTAFDPQRLAHNTGSKCTPLETGRGEFNLPLWGRKIVLSYPEFVARAEGTGEELSPMDQAMLLYYFSTADGVPTGGKWISFSELSDGRFYNQAFQGYTGQPLVSTFQNDQGRFEQAAQGLGGEKLDLGSASFAFQALPRVALMLVFWLGDEDFPSSYQILFDASANHYLPTDAYAILGSGLTRRLIRKASPGGV